MKALSNKRAGQCTTNVLCFTSAAIVISFVAPQSYLCKPQSNIGAYEVKLTRIILLQPDFFLEGQAVPCHAVQSPPRMDMQNLHFFGGPGGTRHGVDKHAR